MLPGSLVLVWGRVVLPVVQLPTASPAPVLFLYLLEKDYSFFSVGPASNSQLRRSHGAMAVVAVGLKNVSYRDPSVFSHFHPSSFYCFIPSVCVYFWNKMKSLCIPRLGNWWGWGWPRVDTWRDLNGIRVSVLWILDVMSGMGHVEGERWIVGGSH